MLIKPLNTVSSHLFLKNLLIFNWNPVYRSSFVLGLASIVIFVCWSFCQPNLARPCYGCTPTRRLSQHCPMQFLLAILSWGGWLSRCCVQLHSGTILVTLSLLIGYYKSEQETGSKFVHQNSHMVQFDSTPTHTARKNGFTTTAKSVQIWSKYHIWSNLFIFAPRQIPSLDNICTRSKDGKYRIYSIFTVQSKWEEKLHICQSAQQS